MLVMVIMRDIFKSVENKGTPPIRKIDFFWALPEKGGEGTF